MNSHSLVYRALVVYSNERTGEIRVKIPSRIGVGSDVSISFIAREKTNNLWVVPAEGSQIVVSADDENMTNIFWLHTDAINATTHFRNYFQAYSTANQSVTPGSTGKVSYTNVDLSYGIRLVDSTKITFDYAGTYNLQFSIQWKNTDTQIHEAGIWLAYQGSHYPNSTTYTSVPSSHGGIPGTAVTAINLLGQAIGNGDYVELEWSTNGNITMSTVPSSVITGMPADIPNAPSIIVTVTQVA